MTLSRHRTRLSRSLEHLALLSLTLAAFVIPLSVTATTLTFLSAFLFILLSGNWQHRWQVIKHNPAALSFWGIFALFLLGLFYTHSTHAAAFKDLQKRHWLLMTPFFVMILTDERTRKQMINAFLIAMVITLALSYAKLFGLGLVIKLTPKDHYITNVFFEHIVQYFFMSIAAFIFAYRFLFEKRWRGFNLAIFLLMAINLFYFSMGRTGYLQLGALLIFLAYLRFRWKGVLLCMAACSLIFSSAFYFSSFFNTRISLIAKNANQFTHGNTKTPIGLRLAMWEDTKFLIKKHPWFGVGTGGIKTTMQRTLPAKQLNKTGAIDYVENSALNFTLQFGLFGLISFIGFMLIQCHTSTQLTEPYKHIMQAFLIAFFIGSLANSFFVSFCEAHLFALFAALCFSSYESPAQIAPSQSFSS